MVTFLAILALALVLATHALVGAEHGVYWNADSDNLALHDVNLWTTWVIRALYGVLILWAFSPSISLGIFYVGLMLLSQSLFQVALNYFAGNGPFSGEQDEAEFSWWPASRKIFANRRRIVQALIGIALMLFTIL